jgi:hypothetical protein
LNRNRWTALPIPADVIDWVHTLARRSGAAQGLTFTDRSGIPYVDPDDEDSDDESYDPDDNSIDPDDDDFLPGDDLPLVGVIPDANVNDIPIVGVNGDNNEENEENEENKEEENNEEDAANIADEEETDEETDNEETNEEANEATNEENEENEGVNNEVDDTNDANHANETLVETVENDETLAEEITARMNAKYGERNGTHNLRARRPRDYSHLHATVESTVMTQHFMKQGIKLFGDAGIEAVLKELKQLHDRKVLEPADAKKLSKDKK